MDNQFTEAQWQEQLNQWKLGYELDVAQITGEYQGKPTSQRKMPIFRIEEPCAVN